MLSIDTFVLSVCILIVWGTYTYLSLSHISTTTSVVHTNCVIMILGNVFTDT